MRFGERLKGAAVALILLMVCFPMAVAGTLFSAPVWLWIESTLNIEAYGHSGPAGWCYLVFYGFLVAIGAMVWSRMVHKK